MALVSGDHRFRSDISRRDFLKIVGGAGLSLGLAGSVGACARGSAGSDNGKSVTVPVGTFAGVNNVVITKYAEPKFKESHPGVTLNITIRTAAENYPKLKASPNRPSEAIGMWNDTFSALGNEAGLFVKMDQANLPNLKDAIQDVQPKDGVGIAVAIQPYGIAYNPQLVEKPTSWLDLFNPKYKGKVCMHENFWDQYVALAYILGSNEHNLGVAVDEWAKHKENIGFWSTSFTQLQELVDKGEMWLGPQWGGFTVAAQRSGLNIDFSWPKEGATQQSILVDVNKGFSADVQKTAEQFANVWLDPEVQSGFLTEAGLSPTNTKVKIPSEYAAYEGVITPDRLKDKKLIRYDYAYVGSHLNELTQMINEKLK